MTFLSDHKIVSEVFIVTFFPPDDHYTIASTFSVALEFRTRKRSGIILSISHNRGRTALALEIFDGQVSQNTAVLIFRL